MIRGKEAFISHVSRCLGRDSVPAEPPVFTAPSDVQHEYLRDADREELKKTFVANSEFNGTLIFSCTEDDLATTLLEAVAAFDKGAVVLGDHPYFREQGVIEALQEKLDDCYLWDTGKSREENMARAESAMVGISMAGMGLAESGTVILFSEKGTGRSVSLLPTYAVTVVRAADLRPRLTQGMEFLRERKRELPSSVNFISGASSTADIELVPVKGVHGPLKIAYVIVE
jgi:L-lactate dehydrogenase complex protein LldG